MQELVRFLFYGTYIYIVCTCWPFTADLILLVIPLCIRKDLGQKRSRAVEMSGQPFESSNVEDSPGLHPAAAVPFSRFSILAGEDRSKTQAVDASTQSGAPQVSWKKSFLRVPSKKDLAE